MFRAGEGKMQCLIGATQRKVLGKHLFIQSSNLCLFVCLIKTHETLDWFASNFDSGTRNIHGNVFNSSLRVV